MLRCTLFYIADNLNMFLLFYTQIKDQFHNGNYATRAVMARDHDFDTEFKNVLMKQMVSFSSIYSILARSH